MSILEKALGYLGYQKQAPISSLTEAGSIFAPLIFGTGLKAQLTEPYILPYRTGFGVPRNVNQKLLKEFAQTYPIQMVLTTLLREVEAATWSIVPKDEENYNEEHIEIVQNFMKNCTLNGDDFEEVTSAVCRDLLCYDQGILVKIFNKAGQMIAVMPYEGVSFLLAPDAHGILPEDRPAYYQYSLMRPQTQPIAFTKREIVYFRQNQIPGSVYGFSNIQALWDIISSLDNSSRWNAQFFKKNAIPDGVLISEDANEEDLKKLSANLQRAAQGNPHGLAFFNKALDFKDLVKSARDMEWLSGQILYLKLVFACFGVSPSEAGFTDAVNKASAESQERVHARKAVRPLLNLLQRKWNQEIIPEIIDNQGNRIDDVILQYQQTDVHEEQRMLENILAQVKSGLISVNEARKELGWDMVEDPTADELRQVGGFGGFDMGGMQLGARKPLTTKNNFFFKKDIRSDAKFYASAFIDLIRNMKKKALALVGKGIVSWEDIAKVVIIPKGFEKDVAKAVKNTFLLGITAVEKEQGVQIGFRDQMNITVKFLTDQQMDGYSLADAQIWHGINGVTQEIRAELSSQLVEGLNARESMTQISDRVKKVFDVSESRAMVIARTETNRIVNRGKLSAYEAAGVEGTKTWVTHVDDRTSDICRRLNGQRVRITDTFKDTSTGLEFMTPPAHPNCRSTIQFKTEKFKEAI